jgi:hypothetical protein
MPELAVVVAAFVAGAIAVVLAERAFHGSGRSGIHFRSWSGSTSQLNRSRVQPTQEQVAEMLRQDELLQQVVGSPMTRVIGVGATRQEDGLNVEFPFVELREAGGRASYRVRANVRYQPMAAPPDPWGAQPQPVVEDDLGTAYAVGLATWGGGGGDDTHSEAIVEFTFAPAPPITARTIRVTVPYVDPSRGRPAPTRPGWTFDVPL